MQLPVYDLKRKCPKCHHAVVGAVYHNASRRRGFGDCPACDDNRYIESSKAKEHLLRICRNCMYEWAEKTLSEEVVAQ